MTTIHDIPKDVIAAHIASRLSVADKRDLMACSWHLRAACQLDSAWETAVKELFLKKQGTHYETVKNFHIQFNAFSDKFLPKTSEGVFARIFGGIMNVFNKEKVTLFEANIQQWKSAKDQNLSLPDVRGDINNTNDIIVPIEIAFQLHKIDPNINFTKYFCEGALEKGYLKPLRADNLATLHDLLKFPKLFSVKFADSCYRLAADKARRCFFYSNEYVKAMDVLAEKFPEMLEGIR